MTGSSSVDASPPTLRANRLLLVGTGSLGVAFLPFWLNWLRITYPETEVRVVLTRSAERFVAREAVTAISGSTVERDEWPEEPEPGARHVAWTQWADTIAVYPATLHFVARLATGLADTPALLALQCTGVPVGVAPALPPGAERNSLYQEHVAALEHRGNIAIAPPHYGRSATTEGRDAAVAAPLPQLLEVIEKRCYQDESSAQEKDTDGSG